MLPLCDVIDGTNVSEEWGEKNLDLEGTNDVEWAKAKNKKGKEFGGKWAHGAFAREGRKSKREMWQSLVHRILGRSCLTCLRMILSNNIQVVDCIKGLSHVPVRKFAPLCNFITVCEQEELKIQKV
ncbi:conserved hypothetical protein [Microsporum canis CBS 113480]|uniref:Uncharacterized protein n=1 Tax=Arthroderma otae (strain ATCC MYA-4605 / CBS 113480) TaxID=554155 RepID=C5FXD6_ARTOC|nr:conserved hypothetical protein [Microsporum canis CBS 113480]EEQ34976.1 conserved hypothetical protein [Microsporum canis CBS 113480]